MIQIKHVFEIVNHDSFFLGKKEKKKRKSGVSGHQENVREMAAGLY